MAAPVPEGGSLSATAKPARDELRPTSQILGAPARALVPALALGIGFMAGVNLVLGAVLAVLGPTILILMHRHDPDALDLWLARLRPPWWSGWTIGVKRRPVLWLD